MRISTQACIELASCQSDRRAIADIKDLKVHELVVGVVVAEGVRESSPRPLSGMDIWTVVCPVRGHTGIRIIMGLTIAEPIQGGAWGSKRAIRDWSVLKAGQTIQRDQISVRAHAGKILSAI